MYFFVMFCNIKSATDRETIPVSVTVNGVEFATSSFDFYYYYDCTITSISPSTGPISGGTTIVVTGTNFLASTLLSCRFGESTITSAIYLNSTSIQCLTPVSALGAKSFDVTVSNNGKDFSECNVSFKYINEVKVTSIYPVYGSISGGTNVTVLGYGFEVDTQYTCQFGMKQKVLATVVSKTEMRCTSPQFVQDQKMEAVFQVLDGSFILPSKPYNFRFLKSQDDHRNYKIFSNNYDESEQFHCNKLSRTGATETGYKISGFESNVSIEFERTAKVEINKVRFKICRYYAFSQR